MIEIKNLTKRFGDKLAVDNISFNVQRGEIVGFLGPNGAGKTTTMNIVTGYISSTSGTVTIDGHDILDDATAAKACIGYLPEQPPLYVDMTVEEYLNFVCDLKGVKANRKEHLKEICDLVKINDVYKRVIKNLSKGYKQRVGFAQALVGNPPVLILDEPTVGLDPNQIVDIRNLIKSLGKNHTVILSSHILTEVQAVCERIVVISKGKIVADDRSDMLSKAVEGCGRLLVKISGKPDAVLKALKTVDGVRGVKLIPAKDKEEEREYEVEAVNGVDIRKPLFSLCSRNGWFLLGSKPLDVTLEDVFMQLTKEDVK